MRTLAHEMSKWPLIRARIGLHASLSIVACTLMGRGGNRAGRAGPKLTWFLRAKILTVQPVLKIGPVGPNSFFKAKKNSGGLGQIWPCFFWANNLMAQPDPNFGRTELAHRVGPILPSLLMGHNPMNKPKPHFFSLNEPFSFPRFH